MLAIWFNRSLPWLMGVFAIVIVALNPNQSATIQWTPPQDAQWAEVRLRFLDKEPVSYSETKTVTSNEIPAFRPRSGHWAAEVRVCKNSEDGSLCSVWVKSDVEGQPEPWVIFWKPPLTTGIIVEDEGAN